MSIDLVIANPISSNPQPISDQNGNASALSLATSSASVNGSLSVSGGSVSVFSGFQQLYAGNTYTADTDGFIFATVFPPPSNQSIPSFLNIVCTLGNVSTGWVTGALFEAPSAVVPMGTSLLLPVPNGTEFVASITGKNGSNPPAYLLWWCPLGQSAVGTPVQI